MRKISLIFLGFTISWGLEYRFNQIAAVPQAAIAAEPFFIYDTDHDGLEEIIVYTFSYERPYGRRGCWQIWEYRSGFTYEREYMGPDTTELFIPYTVGDIDEDGLADVIGFYYNDLQEDDTYETIMLESPNPFSHPTQAVWEVRYTLKEGDTNNFWWNRPVVADITRNGKNELIILYYGDIYIAKCAGDNKLEFVKKVNADITPSYFYIPGLGDFDQDEKFDITAARPGTFGCVKIYENTTGYDFKEVFRDSLLLFCYGEVYPSKDSDGDGEPEIFLPYERDKRMVYLYRWETTGDNSYSRILVDSAKIDSGIPWGRSACGDIDRDRIEEIAWSIGTDIYIYKSTGNDKYERVWHWIPPYYKKWDAIYTQLKIHDMNKNGYGEIIISFYNKDTSPRLDTIQIFEIDTTCLSIASNSPIFKAPNLTISPNPMKGITDIRYEIPERGPISLQVYDATGRLVRTLTRTQSQESRAYTTFWDGKDDKDKLLPPGIYFCELRTGDYKITKKIILAR